MIFDPVNIGTKRWLLRIFWLLIIFSCFSWAFIIVSESLVSWNETPTITTIDTYSLNVKSLQYPTIAVCPDNWDYDAFGLTREMLDYRENSSEFEFFLSDLKIYFHELLLEASQKISRNPTEDEIIAVKHIYPVNETIDINGIRDTIAKAFLGDFAAVSQSLYREHFDAYIEALKSGSLDDVYSVNIIFMGDFWASHLGDILFST